MLKVEEEAYNYREREREKEDLSAAACGIRLPPPRGDTRRNKMKGKK